MYQYKCKYPGLTDKLKCAIYKRNYFHGVINLNFNIIICKDDSYNIKNPNTCSQMVSYVYNSYFTVFNRSENSSTLVLVRPNKIHP